MLHKLRRFILATILPFAVLITHVSTLAGSINGEESRVIAVAKGTFEYKGEKYAAKQGYVDQLTAKLSQDDYDLTKEEADQAIAAIYANVESGVQEGYIVKVSGDGTDAKNNANPSNNKDYGEEKSDSSNYIEEADDTVVWNKDTSDNVQMNEQEESARVSVPYSPPSVIKETGFHLHTTVYVLLGGIFILVTCVYMVVKDRVKRLRFGGCYEEEPKK